VSNGPPARRNMHADCLAAETRQTQCESSGVGAGCQHSRSRRPTARACDAVQRTSHESARKGGRRSSPSRRAGRTKGRRKGMDKNDFRRLFVVTAPRQPATTGSSFAYTPIVRASCKPLLVAPTAPASLRATSLAFSTAAAYVCDAELRSHAFPRGRSGTREHGKGATTALMVSCERRLPGSRRPGRRRRR